MGSREVEIWSGLEPEGMREAKCSLLLPVDGKYQPKVKMLAKQKQISVWQDPSDRPDMGLPGGKTFKVDFQGATILQLEPSNKVSFETMPQTLTVAGKCFFTEENYKCFGIMMRNEEQSDTISVAPNGSFTWPDVKAFLTCPVCGAEADIPRDSEELQDFWMVFYPLLQIDVQKGNKIVVASRLICRLTCLDCMTDLCDQMKLSAPNPDASRGKSGSRRHSLETVSLSIMEILEEAGTASFLQDEPPRPESSPNVDDPLDAWTLYQLWEHSGTWEALQTDLKKTLVRSMQTAASAPVPEITATDSEDGDKSEDSETEQLAKASAMKVPKERLGRKCGSPDCNNVHGKKDADGEFIRLRVVCDKCKSVYYCSKSCRKQASQHHKESCKVHQDERDKQLKRVQCDVCKRVLPFTQMKKCSRCRKPTYCSVECQKKDWPKHKKTCWAPPAHQEEEAKALQLFSN